MADFYFSPSEKMFYSSRLQNDYKRAGTWPTDAMPVTKDQYAEFAGQPPAGMELGAGNTGAPAWQKVIKQELSIDTLATAALTRINAGYTQAMNAILAEYPDAETLSFDKQEQQARAWDAWQKAGAVPDDEPATAYLDAMLAERPIGKAELVSRILEKADQFETLHGAATGRRQKLEDEVKAAQAAGDRAMLKFLMWRTPGGT